MNKTNKILRNIYTLKNIDNRFRQSVFSSILLILFAVFVIFTAPAKAQDNVNAGVEGVVYDENRKPIPDAIVVITNIYTGVESRTRTDSNGRFRKVGLRPDDYTVQVLSENYLESIIQRPFLATKTTLVLPDFILTPKVSVVAASTPTPDPNGRVAANSTPTPSPTPVPNGSDINIGQIRRDGAFTSDEIVAIPLGGTTLVRSFDELALLVPGVAPPPQAIGNSVGPGVGPGVGTSGQFSVNGLRSRANNFMVDGSDNNDEDIGVRRQGFFTLIPQPIESVQEFQIITLLAPAQFGRNLGAQVNVLSKSGTNSFHGNLYTFFNSDKLNARNNFDFVGNTPEIPLQGRQRNGNFVNVILQGANASLDRQLNVRNPAGDKDSLTFLQGGGTFGGPIVKNKMFFFVSAEGQVLNAAQETHFVVPTVEERGFLGTGAQGFTVPSGGRRFPTSVTGDLLLGLFPFPNDPTGLYGRNTYTRSLPADARGRIISGKYDYNFPVGEKQQFLTARYNHTDDWRDLQQVGGAVFSSIRPLTRTDNFSTFISGELTDNLTNVLRFSWGRTRLRYEENKAFNTEEYLRPINRNFTNSEESRFLLSALSLVNITLPASSTSLPTEVRYGQFQIPIETFIGPVGQLNISGYSPLGVDVFNFPQKRVNNTYQIADTVFLRSGNNDIAFGTDIRRTILDSDLPRNSRLLITSTGAFGNSYNPGSNGIPGCTPTLLSAGTLCVPQLISPIDLIASGNTTGVFQSLVLPNNDANINLSFNQFNFFAQDDYTTSKRNLKISFGLRYELNTVPKESDNKIENSFQTTLPSAVSGLSNFIKGRSQIFDLDRNNLAPRIGFAYSPDNSIVIRGGYGIYYDQILGAVVSQSRNVFPTFTTVNFGGRSALTTFPQGDFFTISTPYNASCGGMSLIQPGTLNTLNVTQSQLFSCVAASGFPTPFGATIPERNLDTPFSHQYSIGVEKQLFPKTNTVISVAYVGTAGRNLLRFSTPNLGRNNIANLGSLNFADFQPNFVGTNTAPARSTANIGPIDQFETTGRSRYDSLQLQLRGRLTSANQAFQYQVSYTLGNAKDDVSDVFDLAGAFALPQDSVNPSGEYAAANFDVRHRFAYNFIYDVPKLNNRNKVLNYILGDWQIAGTGTYNTGQPFTVNSIYDINQDGNLTDRLDKPEFVTVTNDRRQPLTRTCNPNLGGCLGALVAIGTDGSVPRNSFRAGSVLELNMAVSKRFFIKESQNILLRFDIFNFINRANFGVPVRFLEAPNFGQAVETITPGRRIQIALKYNF